MCPWIHPEDGATAAAPDLVVQPHHFDRLRRPPCADDGDPHGVLQQALAWNVFRTLELLPPAFWLRRLRARLQDSNLGIPAPSIVRVSLWQPLEPSPAQALDAGTARVIPDVVIETEFTVWTLVTLAGRDLDDCDEAPADPLLRTIDAGSWYAGRREYCFGLIVNSLTDTPVAVSRARHYARHRMHVMNRLPARPDGLRNLGAIGVGTWRDLRDILEDCALSDALAPVERAIASHALEWLCGAVGRCAPR